MIMLDNKDLISSILFAFFRKMSKAKTEKKDEKSKKKNKSIAKKKGKEDDVTSLKTSTVNKGVTKALKSKNKSAKTSKGKKSNDGNKGLEKFIVRAGFYTNWQKSICQVTGMLNR